MTEDRWRTRQGTALLGLVPLTAVILGGMLGGLAAAGLGGHDWIGILLGAVGGYFLSRWLLRRVFVTRA